MGYAFTLAEVLIVLGIIGLIADMTLPTLVSSYKKQAAKANLTKLVSTLNQASLMTVAQLGYASQCYHVNLDGSLAYAGGDCEDFQNALYKNLRTTKICKNNAFAQGCIPKYRGNDAVYNDDTNLTEEQKETLNAGCSGFSTNNILNNDTVFVLADGSIIIEYAGIQTRSLVVDINGFKKPNKWGYDMFGIHSFGKSGIAPVFRARQGSDCAPVEKGGIDAYTLLYK